MSENRQKCLFLAARLFFTLREGAGRDSTTAARENKQREKNT